MIVSFEDKGLYEFNKIAHSWNLDFIQLSAGKLSADLTQIISPDVQLGYAAMNCSVRQEGFSPPGMWTFAFTNDVKIFWRNFVVKPESIIIYAPESEINAVSDPGFEVMTFSISEKYLLNWAKENKCLDVIQGLNETELIETTDKDRSFLRELIGATIQEAINHQIETLENFNTEIFLSKLCGLIRISEFAKEKVNSQKRLETLKMAEGIMEKNFNEPLKVDQLSSLLGISERTLLYIFKQRFDMGPKAFMKILKLNRAYHALQDSAEPSIAQIARAIPKQRLVRCALTSMTIFRKM